MSKVSMESLPEEIISMVIDLATECECNAGGCEPACGRTHTLLSYMAFSKKWLHAARPLVYEDVYLSNHDRAQLFHRTVSNPSSQLGQLVRWLATGPALEEAPALALLDLLDHTPKIVGLRASFVLCLKVKEHHVWKNIRHLRLFSTDDSRNLPTTEKLLFLNDERLGMSLKTLTIEGGLEPLCQAEDWSKLTFPQLKTLSLIDVPPNPLSLAPPRHRRLLPELPQDVCLKLVNVAGPRLLTPRWERLIMEKSEVLTNLHISLDPKRKKADLCLLSAHLLPKLRNLQQLHWTGPGPALGLLGSLENTIRPTFPSSLQRVNLTLVDSPNYAEDFMALLCDPSFLPNLVVCPAVTVIFDAKRTVQWKPSRIRRLLLLGYKVTRHWKAHRRATFLVETLNAVKDYPYIPCLPYPGPYKSSLQKLVLQAMNGLEASGEVVSEEQG